MPVLALGNEANSARCIRPGGRDEHRVARSGQLAISRDISNLLGTRKKAGKDILRSTISLRSNFQFWIIVTSVVVGCRGTPASVLDPMESELRRERVTWSQNLKLGIAESKSHERAVVFMHVDWATMSQQRSVFLRWVHRQRETRPTDRVFFQYLNCTEQSHEYASLRNLDGWKEIEESKKVRLIGGYGEVMWMKNGKVFAIETMDVTMQPEDLMELTDRIFSNDFLNWDLIRLDFKDRIGFGRLK
jgi:hypothetical protein